MYNVQLITQQYKQLIGLVMTQTIEERDKLLHRFGKGICTKCLKIRSETRLSKFERICTVCRESEANEKKVKEK